VIASRLNNAAAQQGERPFLITADASYSYREAQHATRQLAWELLDTDASTIACYLPDSPELIILTLGASLAGKPLAIINRGYSAQQVAELLVDLDADLLFSDVTVSDIPCAQSRPLSLAQLCATQGKPDAAFAEVDTELFIYTSGTTQKPRCVSYLWSDLLAQVGERKALNSERWLLAYKLNHFAGVQMLAHILRSHSTLVLADSTRVADAVEAMQTLAVTHVSSTPTFWRFALTLLAAAPQLPALQQITLGSEPVSVDLLKQLAALFPAARIVHIYALTEAGSCISVSDGKAGLPQSILDRPEDAPVRFRIVAGELQVLTHHGMQGYRNEQDGVPRTADGWLATGDLVRVEQDRILFMGRESEVINVGGVKVHPLEVETVVCALPGVKLARVYGQDNPVVGQIVAVDLVAQEGWDSTALEDSVREACLGLPRHSMPRSVNIVDAIDTNNFKLARRGSESQ
jgi:acyl-CoA synthetase (AMP-forming)/AMP-acid ligase II